MHEGPCLYGHYYPVHFSLLPASQETASLVRHVKGAHQSLHRPSGLDKLTKTQFSKIHLADGQMSDELEPSEVSSWEPSLLLCGPIRDNGKEER